MPYPTPKVYVAFDDGPYVLSPTWTEITTSVRSMSTDRGRGGDWDNFSGSATVVLNNRERLYDPFYTSGTYYGKLLPRRQIKIEATYAGYTYPIFRGFIDGWPPTWTDAGGDSTVTLSCYDAMQLLAQVQLPADWSQSYILSTSPRHYYPCDDPIIPYQTNILTDLGSVKRNIALNAAAWPGQQLAAGLVDQSVQGYGTPTLDYIGTSFTGETVFTTQGMFSVSFWCIPDVQFSTTIAYGMVSGWLWFVGFDNNKFNLLIQKPGTGTTSYSWETSTTLISVSEPIHFSASVFAFNSAQLFINGVDRTGAYSTGVATVGATYGDYTVIVQGPIQQIIVWDKYIYGYEYQDIIKYSLANFGETTAARVSRIIAQTPFSTSLVSANGTRSIGEITDNAPYAGPELQITANTEGGPLYVSNTGVLTQTATYTQFTQSESFTTQATYGSGGLGLGQNVALQYDGDSMRNVINVNMTGGGVTKVTGSVSTGVYGQATQSWESYMPSISQSSLVGNILVGLGQYVFARFEDFEVVISPDANWATTLGLELLERIDVNVAPPTGNVISQSLQLNRIRHEVQPGLWQTFLNGSDRWGSAFRLNVSLLDGPDVLLYAQ
jgi:hypothetical protein